MCLKTTCLWRCDDPFPSLCFAGLQQFKYSWRRCSPKGACSYFLTYKSNSCSYPGCIHSFRFKPRWILREVFFNGLNMLDIPEIYPNFTIDLWNFFVSRWILEISKVLWKIPIISLRPERDDMYVSWTRQRYTYEVTSELSMTWHATSEVSLSRP